MLTDKVNHTRNTRSSNRNQGLNRQPRGNRWTRSFLPRVCFFLLTRHGNYQTEIPWSCYVIDTAGANLKVVSTMSVGYGASSQTSCFASSEEVLTRKNHRACGFGRPCETGSEARLYSRCIERRWWVDHALVSEPCEGCRTTSRKLSPRLDSGRPFRHVGVNGWSERWEGPSACEERRGRVTSASARTAPGFG